VVVREGHHKPTELLVPPFRQEELVVVAADLHRVAVVIQVPAEASY
jgi:hypothetical protein